MFYRSAPAPKGVGSGHRVHVLLLVGGRGFTYDILDGKDNLIRRDHTHYDAPGLAVRAGLKWLEEFREHL